eukprot:m.28449 g.28449  ORF g.28449 m.28449 type:complete len:58 (+) comp9040_c0_seq3:487-660(+)
MSQLRLQVLCDLTVILCLCCAENQSLTSIFAGDYTVLECAFMHPLHRASWQSSATSA